MRLIFSHAEIVYAWLGNAVESTKAGIELIWDTCRAVQHLPDSPVPTLDSSVLTLESLGLPATMDPKWEAVAEIISRSWFIRVWVIQEATVARKLVFLCGELRIGSEVLRAFANAYSPACSILQDALSVNIPKNTEDRTYELQAAMLMDLVSKYARYGPFELCDLLLHTACFRATDPRDKTFALLGLTNDLSPAFINYNRDSHDILYDVGLFCIKKNSVFINSLNTLCFVAASIPESNLPSWLPSWNFGSGGYCSTFFLVDHYYDVEVGEARYSIDDKVPNPPIALSICFLPYLRLMEGRNPAERRSLLRRVSEFVARFSIPYVLSSTQPKH